MLEDLKCLKNRTVQISMGIFALLYGIAKSLSNYVYEQNTLNVNVLHILGYTLLCYVTLNCAYALINREWRVPTAKIKSPWRLWLLFFIILMFLYTLCWLTFWPAIIANDNFGIFLRDMEASSQHTVFYTGWVVLTQIIGKHFGTMRTGIIIYMSMQIPIIAAAVSYLLMRLFELRISRIFKLMTALFFLFLPAFMVMGVQMIKDTPWTAALIVLCVKLYDIMQASHPRRKDWLIFWIAGFFVMSMRNNGSYMLVGTVLMMLMFGGKSMRRHAYLTLGLVFLTMSIWIGIQHSMGYRQMFQEKVSVPLQQIAATVVKNGKITEHQMEFINALASAENFKQRYNPYTADTIKWDNQGYDRQPLEDHRAEFLRVWAQMLIPNFQTYVLAYLQTSYWWWAPRQDDKLYIRQIEASIDDDHRPWLEQRGLVSESVLPGKIGQYLRVYYDLDCYFLREGVILWLFAALIMLYGLKYRNWRIMTIFAPCVCLWLTIMIAAPISFSFRYIMGIVYLLPYYTAQLLQSEEQPIATERFLFKRWMKYALAAGIIIALSGIPVSIQISRSIPTVALVGIYSDNLETKSFDVIHNGKKLEEISWLQQNNQRGNIAMQDGNQLNLQIKVLADGDITIELRPSYERNRKDEPVPNWLEYLDFTMNGKRVINCPCYVWPQHTHKYILPARKGEVYEISAKWRKI